MELWRDIQIRFIEALSIVSGNSLH